MTLRQMMTVLRGLRFTLRLRLTGQHVGRGLRVGKSARIIARSGGSIRIGKGVVIGDSAVLSALRGGSLTLGDRSGVGACSRLICHEKIEIGAGCNIAPHVYFFDHDHVFDAEGVHRDRYKTGPITVGDNSWIAVNTVVLRGTDIGEACLIAAGSVVRGTVPAHSRFIQKRSADILPVE